MSANTHTAIATTARGVLEVIQVTTSDPGPGEVQIKVAYASLIAFDTYVTDSGYYVDTYPVVLGFNAAGTVTKVGPDVDDLQVGDRVTAFAYQGSQPKAVQEYAVLPQTVTAKIPDSLSFADAATIPDNLTTAFTALFSDLALPLPASFTEKAIKQVTTPILIYGGSSTAGLYAIQLLHIAGYTNIIVTASPRNHAYLRSLGATTTIDYNSATLADEIAQAVGGDGKVRFALDCITADATLQAVAKVISPDGGVVAILLPVKAGSTVTGPPGTEMVMAVPEANNPLPKGARYVGVRAFLYQSNDYLRKNLFQSIIPQLLASRLIQPNRVRLLDQGTLKERVAVGLDLLRNNKVSGEKVVVKIDA